jgi:hypothetical protein
MQLFSASPVLLGAMLALALSAPAPAQMPAESIRMALSSPREADEGELLAPVEFRDVRLRGMVEELELRSPSAATMLQSIRRAGFPLTFGTFADLAEEMQQEYRSWSRGARSAAGYMAPVVRSGPGFAHPLTTVKINVAVNLAILDELFEEADTVESDIPIAWSEVQRLETLAVLAHEIAHAYGLAMSGGDPRYGCPDPHEGDRPQDSCVMIGENVVRSELGAPLDWDYGFPTLVSLAERYSEASARRALLLELGAARLIRPLEPELPRRRAIEP